MRLLPGLTLALSLAFVSQAEGRLFWQTYGSTVPAADGCGCTWNVNQDYFVPRHSSSCRYGLFSPCKTSCTNSPACKRCHPLYPGYCTIYGPCHYARRNHVYRARCGCSPVEFGGICGGGQPASSCCAAIDSTYSCSPVKPLYNVEPSRPEILGSIPVEGSDLLTTTDFSQLGELRRDQLKLQPQDALQQLKPLLGLPSAGENSTPAPRP